MSFSHMCSKYLLVWLLGGIKSCVQDASTAKALAFNKDVRTRCITLDGDDFNPGGTLTGYLLHVSQIWYSISVSKQPQGNAVPTSQSPLTEERCKHSECYKNAPTFLA